MFWLLASFILGIVTLLYDVTSVSLEDPGSEGNSWSFGQIMPIILLAIPFITIVENLYTDEAPVHVLHTEARRDVSSSPPLLPRLEERHDEDKGLLAFNPDRDYYHVSSSMKAGTVCILIVEAFLGCLMLVSAFAQGSFAADILHRLKTAIPLTLFSLWCIILFSLRIDWVVPQKAGKRYVLKRLLLQFANVAFFTTLPTYFMFSGF